VILIIKVLVISLIRTVMGYGAEVWGWRERREVEEIHERFILRY